MMGFFPALREAYHVRSILTLYIHTMHPKNEATFPRILASVVSLPHQPRDKGMAWYRMYQILPRAALNKFPYDENAGFTPSLESWLPE